MRTPDRGQGKLLKVVENIQVADKDVPSIDQQTGQIKLLNITPELKPLADFFATKFEAAQQANQVLSNQVGRLSNSVANLATKWEDKVVHDKNPDLVISPYADLDSADVAYVDSALPAEAWYPFSTSQLATPVDIKPSRLGLLFRLAGIQGNPKFHYAITSGKSTVIQRYRSTALRELFDLARAGKVNGIKPWEVEKLNKYFVLQRSLAE